MIIDIIYGGQYGSEGKGQVAAMIAPIGRYDMLVRVGGPNAGHTVVLEDGRKFVTRHIPSGAITTDAQIYLGPGALINPDVLNEEIKTIEKQGIDIRQRLRIDERAIIIHPHHLDLEGGTEGRLHERIGSTGEGVGAARVSHLLRNPADVQHAGDIWTSLPGRVIRGMPSAERVLIEGTQGFGLDIVLGPWPYCTTGRITPAGLLADAGLPVSSVRYRIAVVRTFPIRVAGNSGPMYDEVDWERVSKVARRNVVERTTVTGKVRRVGTWDPDLFAEMVKTTKPSHIAVTFLDYIFGGKMFGISGSSSDDIPTDIKQWAAERIANFTGYQPFYWGTGPDSAVILTAGLED